MYGRDLLNEVLKSYEKIEFIIKYNQNNKKKKKYLFLNALTKFFLLIWSIIKSADMNTIIKSAINILKTNATGRT